jgi:hypothetical protein
MRDRIQNKTTKVSTSSVQPSLKIEILEKEFLRDFKEYYSIIMNYSRLNTKPSTVCRQLFNDYTIEFYERWKNKISFLRLSPQYTRSPYYSFELIYPRQVVLIPHRIVVFEKYSIGYLKPHLSRVTTLTGFQRLMERVYRDISLKLNSNDIKILKGLTSKTFLRGSDRFPNLDTMARLCRVTRSTFSRRLEYLIEALDVIHLLYRLNISQLGYESYLSIISHDEYSTSFKKFDNYCLAKIPINCNNPINQDNSLLLVSQLPLHKTNLFNAFKTELNHVFFTELLKGYIGWNLSSITPSNKERWTIKPPILSVSSWDELIISENNGIEYNLKPQKYYPHLTPTEISLLSHFEKYSTGRDRDLARSFRVTEKTLKSAWKKIFRNKLLHRFIILSNIGLDIRPWITIIGTKNSHEILRKIVEHLKCFPFSYFFFNTSKNGIPLISGLLYLPPSWVSDFFYKFTQLSDLDLIVDINFSFNRLVKPNISLKETYT